MRHDTFFFCDVRDVCVCDASTRAMVVAGTTDTRRWCERCGAVDGVAHAGVSHAYPDPRGHRYLGSGFTRRKHTYFSRRGAIGTPFRGGKYIFFNFLYGIDIILIVKYYFMLFAKAVGAGRIYRRMFRMITLKIDRV